MPLPTALEGRLRLPVVAAPMFLASGPDLVVGACRAGVLGTFPALNQRTAEGFEQWLDQIEAALTPQDAPYGVNLIVHSSNRRLREDLATIVRHQVPVVITSLGAAAEVVEAVHSYGGLVFHDVTNARFAAKAAAAGVDGIIAVSAGAGGHAGDRNPFALVAEIRSVWDGPLLLSGCLSTGADVLGALAMGADLAYLGTRFLATAEAIAPAEHKAMVVASGAGDVVYTPSISSVPANFLRRSISDAGPVGQPAAARPGGPGPPDRPVGCQGVEGRLLRRPGRAGDPRRAAGRRAGGPAGAGVPGRARPAAGARAALSANQAVREGYSCV